MDVQVALSALAEPRRADLVRRLTMKQLCVRDLVSETGLAQPLVSHHLRVLREARLVETTICANLTVYRMRADTLAALGARISGMAEQAAVTAGVKPC